MEPENRSLERTVVTRRALLAGTMAGTAALGSARGSAQEKKEKGMERLWVFVGTSTSGKSKGIYRFDMDLLSGKLTSRANAFG